MAPCVVPTHHVARRSPCDYLRITHRIEALAVVASPTFELEAVCYTSKKANTWN